MFRSLNYLLIALFHLLGWTASTSAQYTGICFLEGIEGCETEAAHAKLVLPPTTTIDHKACEIYLTENRGHLYAHSNFTQVGAQHPTKLRASIDADLGGNLINVTLNIFGVGGDSFYAQHIVSELHNNNVKFHIDKSLFSPEGKLPFDVGAAKNVNVVFDGRVSKPAIRLQPARGPPQWVAEWTPNVYVKVNSSSDPSMLMRGYEAVPFRATKFRLISLFNDTAVEKRLETSSISRQHLKKHSMSNEGVLAAIKSHRGATIAILGHAEDGRFVTRSTDGSETLIDLRMEQIRHAASESGCEVIYLGCNTGLDAPVGTTAAFNPLFAISRLEQAVQSHTLGDFLSSFASETVGFVLDSAPPKKATQRTPTITEVGIVVPSQADMTSGKRYTIGPNVQGQAGWRQDKALPVLNEVGTIGLQFYDLVAAPLEETEGDDQERSLVHWSVLLSLLVAVGLWYLVR